MATLTLAEKRTIGCWGKRAFPNWAAATRVSKRMNRRHDDARVMPYICPDCHEIHLGAARTEGTPRRRG